MINNEWQNHTNKVMQVFMVTGLFAGQHNTKLHNQLITYYLPVCYFLRIQQYPVNTSYNSIPARYFDWSCLILYSIS